MDRAVEKTDGTRRAADEPTVPPAPVVPPAPPEQAAQAATPATPGPAATPAPAVPATLAPSTSPVRGRPPPAHQAVPESLYRNELRLARETACAADLLGPPMLLASRPQGRQMPQAASAQSDPNVTQPNQESAKKVSTAPSASREDQKKIVTSGSCQLQVLTSGKGNDSVQIQAPCTSTAASSINPEQTEINTQIRSVMPRGSDNSPCKDPACLVHAMLHVTGKPEYTAAASSSSNNNNEAQVTEQPSDSVRSQDKCSAEVLSSSSTQNFGPQETVLGPSTSMPSNRSFVETVPSENSVRNDRDRVTAATSNIAQNVESAPLVASLMPGNYGSLVSKLKGKKKNLNRKQSDSHMSQNNDQKNLGASISGAQYIQNTPSADSLLPQNQVPMAQASTNKKTGKPKDESDTVKLQADPAAVPSPVSTTPLADRLYSLIHQSASTSSDRKTSTTQSANYPCPTKQKLVKKPKELTKSAETVVSTELSGPSTSTGTTPVTSDGRLPEDRRQGGVLRHPHATMSSAHLRQALENPRMSASAASQSHTPAAQLPPRGAAPDPTGLISPGPFYARNAYEQSHINASRGRLVEDPNIARFAKRIKVQPHYFPLLQQVENSIYSAWRHGQYIQPPASTAAQTTYPGPSQGANRQVYPTGDTSQTRNQTAALLPQESDGERLTLQADARARLLPNAAEDSFNPSVSGAARTTAQTTGGASFGSSSGAARTTHTTSGFVFSSSGAARTTPQTTRGANFDTSSGRAVRTPPQAPDGVRAAPPASEMPTNTAHASGLSSSSAQPVGGARGGRRAPDGSGSRSQTSGGARSRAVSGTADVHGGDGSSQEPQALHGATPRAEGEAIPEGLPGSRGVNMPQMDGQQYYIPEWVQENVENIYFQSLLFSHEGNQFMRSRLDMRPLYLEDVMAFWEIQRRLYHDTEPMVPNQPMPTTPEEHSRHSPESEMQCAPGNESAETNTDQPMASTGLPAASVPASAPTRDLSTTWSLEQNPIHNTPDAAQGIAPLRSPPGLESHRISEFLPDIPHDVEGSSAHSVYPERITQTSVNIETNCANLSSYELQPGTFDDIASHTQPEFVPDMDPAVYGSLVHGLATNILADWAAHRSTTFFQSLLRSMSRYPELIPYLVDNEILEYNPNPFSWFSSNVMQGVESQLAYRPIVNMFSELNLNPTEIPCPLHGYNRGVDSAQNPIHTLNPDLNQNEMPCPVHGYDRAVDSAQHQIYTLTSDLNQNEMPCPLHEYGREVYFAQHPIETLTSDFNQAEIQCPIHGYDGEDDSVLHPIEIPTPDLNQNEMPCPLHGYDREVSFAQHPIETLTPDFNQAEIQCPIHGYDREVYSTLHPIHILTSDVNQTEMTYPIHGYDREGDSAQHPIETLTPDLSQTEMPCPMQGQDREEYYAQHPTESLTPDVNQTEMQSPDHGYNREEDSSQHPTETLTPDSDQTEMSSPIHGEDSDVESDADVREIQNMVASLLHGLQLRSASGVSTHLGRSIGAESSGVAPRSRRYFTPRPFPTPEAEDEFMRALDAIQIPDVEPSCPPIETDSLSVTTPVSETAPTRSPVADSAAASTGLSDGDSPPVPAADLDSEFDCTPAATNTSTQEGIPIPGQDSAPTGSLVPVPETSTVPGTLPSDLVPPPSEDMAHEMIPSPTPDVNQNERQSPSLEYDTEMDYDLLPISREVEEMAANMLQQMLLRQELDSIEEETGPDEMPYPEPDNVPDSPPSAMQCPNALNDPDLADCGGEYNFPNLFPRMINCEFPCQPRSNASSRFLPCGASSSSPLQGSGPNENPFQYSPTQKMAGCQLESDLLSLLTSLTMDAESDEEEVHEPPEERSAFNQAVGEGTSATGAMEILVPPQQEAPRAETSTSAAAAGTTTEAVGAQSTPQQEAFRADTSNAAAKGGTSTTEPMDTQPLPQHHAPGAEHIIQGIMDVPFGEPVSRLRHQHSDRNVQEQPGPSRTPPPAGVEAEINQSVEEKEEDREKK